MVTSIAKNMDLLNLQLDQRDIKLQSYLLFILLCHFSRSAEERKGLGRSSTVWSLESASIKAFHMQMNIIWTEKTNIICFSFVMFFQEACWPINLLVKLNDVIVSRIQIIIHLFWSFSWSKQVFKLNIPLISQVLNTLKSTWDIQNSIERSEYCKTLDEMGNEPFVSAEY